MTLEQRQPLRRAVVIDDVALFRLGVSAVLEPLHIDVVAELASARELDLLLDSESIDLLVIGHVSDASATEVVQRVAQRCAEVAIVVLLPRARRDDVAALIALNVHGVLLQSTPLEDLAFSIERVGKGERVVAPLLLSTLVGALDASESPEDEFSLTRREREVLGLLAHGHSNRDIAEALFVTVATVKTHIAHIYEKLGVKNRNEALGRAVALGLLA